MNTLAKNTDNRASIRQRENLASIRTSGSQSMGSACYPHSQQLRGYPSIMLFLHFFSNIQQNDATELWKICFEFVSVNLPSVMNGVLANKTASGTVTEIGWGMRFSCHSPAYQWISWIWLAQMCYSISDRMSWVICCWSVSIETTFLKPESNFTLEYCENDAHNSLVLWVDSYRTQTMEH